MRSTPRSLVAALRALPLLLALSLLAPAAAAEGLVQLTLHGSLTARGGAYVQVEVDRWTGKEVKRHDLHAHLAEGTTARDLAGLLHARFEHQGAVVRYSPDDSDDRAQLFVESATAVNLRLGFGLWAEVTTCEEAPVSIRIDEPQLQVGAAALTLTATTFHEHTDRPGRLRCELPIAKDANTAQIAQDLAARANDTGWVGERPSPDRWTPLRAQLGGAVIACNVRLESPDADWRLEVALRVPER